MSYMIEVYYKAPVDTAREAVLTDHVRQFGGALTYHEPALAGAPVVLTYEFDEHAAAARAAKAIAALGEYVDGPCDYGGPSPRQSSPERGSMGGFVARVATYEVLADMNAVVVVMAQDADGTGERVELQRAIAFDDQDRATGMDTYCVCLASGACHYGGIQTVTLAGRSLHLEFAPEACAALQIETRLAIELDVDAKSLTAIRNGLRAIFVDGRERPTRIDV